MLQSSRSQSVASEKQVKDNRITNVKKTRKILQATEEEKGVLLDSRRHIGSIRGSLQWTLWKTMNTFNRCAKILSTIKQAKMNFFK